ncbi:MAG: hypothetical protein WBO10_02805 [Pyrinomonadaceae bacterium]
MFLFVGVVLPQVREFELHLPVHDPFREGANSTEAPKFPAEGFGAKWRTDAETAITIRSQKLATVTNDDLVEGVDVEPLDAKKSIKIALDEALEMSDEPDQRFRWRPALIQSGLFLAIQHGFRMSEGKTRRELDGPFFRDWKESVLNLHGWSDGGKIFTDYIAHPMQGSLTARIFINNSPRANRAEFGKSRSYWKSRTKALVWAAVWSTQFEIGPISEASLGNVGQVYYNGHFSKMTYGDLVITPVVGVGWTVGEDAIDKFILDRWIEKRVGNRLLIKTLRSVLTPTTAFANILRGRTPWRRDFRRN